MVRFIPGVTATSPVTNKNGSDPLTDLTLLLNRLQRTILHADAEREARLKESEFEREKVLRNITYARSLLTKVEQDTLGIRIHARRQDLQGGLVRKRELLEQLAERLADLAEVGSRRDNEEENEDDTSEGEDILADIIVTPSASESQDSISRPTDEEELDEDDDDDGVLGTPQFQGEPRLPRLPPPPVHTPSQENLQAGIAAAQSTTETKAELRPRKGRDDGPTKEDKPSAISSSSALFGDRNNKSAPTTALSAVTTTEAILDHQRAEQDALSESILQLASQLKASSQAFSMSLEEDKEVVEKAGEGMNKTGEGMDAVTRRMTTLQRMTEGEGWWGRMRLYAIVYGLMVVLVLVVFVMPKLRF